MLGDTPEGDNAQAGAVAPVAETPKPAVSEEYKNLQREIAKRDRKVQALEKQLEGEREKWDGLLGVLKTSPALEADRPQIVAVQEQVGQKAKESESEQAAGELEALLSGSGITLDDWRAQPRFATARTAWSIRHFDDAHILTQQALDRVDPEARAQQLYQEKLKKLGKVDTGETTAGSGHTHDAYVQVLKKGGPLPSAEEIDRIVAERMKEAMRRKE